ncbi:MAG: class I SAM-dependent methyltransferase [Balneola sp.]
MITRSNCPICSSADKKIILTTEGMGLVKCQSCSLIYLKDIPDESVLYEGYHEWTGFNLTDYSAESSDVKLKALWYINRQRIETIKGLKTKGSLLDIGCGSGAFMLTAKEEGFDPSGIDVSDKAIQFIKNELKLNASKDSVSDSEQEFDIVTLWHVLEHFLDPVDKLRAIQNKLSRNGMLVGEVPNWNSIKFQLSGKKWEGGNHPLYHRSFFTPNTLQRTFSEAGFSSFKLIHIPYTSSGKKDSYYFLKKGFNRLHRDAFLTFVALK